MNDWSPQGFYLGCYILEGLRVSQLECLYDQTCLDELQTYIQPTTSVNVTILNASKSIRFSPTTLIGDVIDNLMLEQWDTIIMYEQYYNSCQPARCMYTVTLRNDAIQIVTIAIGLVGGLVTVLKFVVPRAVRLIFKCIRRRRRIAVAHTSHTLTISPIKEGQVIVIKTDHPRS